MPLGISWEAFVQASSVLWSVNIAAWIDDMAAVTGRNIEATNLEPQTLATYQSGRSISGVEIIGALDLRNAVTRSAAKFFSTYDLLLTPTLPDLAPLVGTYTLGAMEMDGHQWTNHVLSSSPFTPVFNAAGFPLCRCLFLPMMRLVCRLACSSLQRPDEKICFSAWLVNLNGRSRGLAASPAYGLDQ